MPDMYTFTDGEGRVFIFVEITDVTGTIDCDFDVRVDFIDGTASKCYTAQFMPLFYIIFSTQYAIQ